RAASSTRPWRATTAAAPASTRRSWTCATPPPPTAASSGAASPPRCDHALPLATLSGAGGADVLAGRLHLLRRRGRADRPALPRSADAPGLHPPPRDRLHQPGRRRGPGAARLGRRRFRRPLRPAPAESLARLGRHGAGAGAPHLAARLPGSVSR